jgi:hypothetical protein
MAFRGNVEGTTTAAEELVLARLRHRAGVGGRSDLIVLDGDVPEGQAWVISQCWDEDLKSVFRAMRSCAEADLQGTDCVLVQSTGNASACPMVLRVAELTPLDPNAAMPDEDDPNSDVAAPEEIPTVAGDENG